MSFTLLPYDDQEQILLASDETTLAALCLVSKSTLELAKPFLYRSVEIHVGYWDMSRDLTLEFLSLAGEVAKVVEGDRSDKEKEEAHNLIVMARRIRLHETLKLNSDISALVQQVTLFFDGADAENREVARHLWSTFPNLRQLSISGRNWSGLDRCLIETCPHDLTSIDLHDVLVPKNHILDLLKHLPLLEYLRLPSQIIHSSLPTEAPVLEKLRSIKLGYALDDANFFALLTKFTPSLSSLELDFLSVQALITSHLSTLRYLSICGELHPPSANEDPLSPECLAKVFAGCTSLEKLEMANRASLGFNMSSLAIIPEFEKIQILHKLPPSLTVLSLPSMSFSSSYLLDFVTSSSASLRCLNISRFIEGGKSESIFGTTLFNTAAEDKMETMCSERGIGLSWVGGRNKDNRARKEGLSVNMLRDIAKALGNM
ncbi:uncharacterized protein JCM6883_006501 [Sporobolomyces salmoneus]|uniref:uncharacterized protein n=1 Tax=Sporobolomyces salmoneus TaxID=183962 RepID=UPI00316C2D53